MSAHSELDIELGEISQGIDDAIAYHDRQADHLRRLRLKIAEMRGPRPSPVRQATHSGSAAPIPSIYAEPDRKSRGFYYNPRSG